MLFVWHFGIHITKCLLDEFCVVFWDVFFLKFLYFISCVLASCMLRTVFWLLSA